MPRDENGLTDKQAAFVREYLKDSNGTQAAIRAGYSEATANEQAARLLAKASVRKALGLKLKKAEITSDWLLKRLRLEAEGKKVPDTTQSGRVSAMGLIAKVQGYVTDKTELTGKDGAPLVVQIVKYSHEDGED